MKKYIVVRSRDKKHFSTPADLRVTEGILEYLESISDTKYTILEVVSLDAFLASPDMTIESVVANA